VTGGTSNLRLADVARRAGVDLATADRMRAAGFIHQEADGGFGETAVRRIRIVQQLLESGLPFDALAEGAERGLFPLDFVDSPAYERFAGHTDETFEALAARTGIPLELVLALREAAGSSQPAPGDPVREIELAAIPAISLLVDYGIRTPTIERMLRAYGESVRRVAEVEADWWGSDVIAPVFASGGTIADVGRLTGPFADALSPLSDQLLLTLLHAHQANAWMKNILEGAETALAASGLHRTVERPPAICFLDLTGYTRLTEEHGDAAAAEMAARLARLVQRTSGEHGGRPIKWLGDGVMFHFRDPGQAVVASLAMVEGAARANLPRAHVGVHAGPVLFQEGDYFGRTVNVAARIADYARQGEILVSQDVVDATVSTEVAFDEIGPVELKGLSEAIVLHVARRAP
jgi:adenylate cyclase